MPTHRHCLHRLEPMQLFTLGDSAPAFLTVTDGTVWLTNGDGEDFVVTTGECEPVAVNERSVASALGVAQSFERAAAAGIGMQALAA